MKTKIWEEIFREAFLAGAKYGYDYRAVTAFPNKTFEDNCEGNAKQKAIKVNPYHPLNELEE